MSVFRNLLIADSGKGHVEEMVRLLRDIPPCRQARINLLHVIPEQGGLDLENHRQQAEILVKEAIKRLGLTPAEVNTVVREGDTKLTVLKVADELEADLIVMGSRGLGTAPIRKEVRSGCCSQHLMNSTPSHRLWASAS